MIFKNIIPEDNSEKRIILTFKSLNKILDHLRVVRINDPNEATLRIYAIDMNNHTLNGLFYKNEQKLLEQYKLELESYINTKIMYLIETVINVLPKQSIEYARSFIDNNTRELTKDLMLPYNLRNNDNSKQITMNDLRLFESNLKQLCKVNETRITKDDIGDITIENTLGILAILIELFNINKFSAKTVISNYKTVNEYDLKNNIKICINLGYLISFLMIELLDRFDDINYINCEENDYDYMKYSNIGMFNVTNMICCFQKEELLPLVVVNQNSKLDNLTKGLLYNMLAISKLTKE